MVKEPDVSDYNGEDVFVANSTVANETGVGVDLCSLYWSEGMYDNHQGWALFYNNHSSNTIKLSANGPGLRALCRSWHVFKLCHFLRVNQWAPWKSAKNTLTGICTQFMSGWHISTIITTLQNGRSVVVGLLVSLSNLQLNLNIFKGVTARLLAFFTIR